MSPPVSRPGRLAPLLRRLLRARLARLRERLLRAAGEEVVAHVRIDPPDGESAEVRLLVRPLSPPRRRRLHARLRGLLRAPATAGAMRPPTSETE